MKIVISESQYKTLMSEHYNSDKLYGRDQIVKRLKMGPRYIQVYIKDLPFIPCRDSEGNERICTKIPEVIYQYLYGRF